MKHTKHNRLTLQVLGLAAISLLGYQNCAPGTLNSKGSASSASQGSFSDCGDNLCEVADVKMVAISNSQNVGTAMLNKAGVSAPSTATTNAFTAQSGKLPETGSVDQITAPAWMAIATMGSEVCNDLLTQETAANATRRIFNSVDFARGPASVTTAAKDDVIRRLARSFWSRNETMQEAALIKSALDDSFSGATAGDTRKAMLFVCTAMLSSTDAQKY